MTSQAFIFAVLLQSIFATDILNLEDIVKYQDCDEVLRSGRYKSPGSYLVFLNSTEPEEVYCHFELGTATIPIMQQKYGHESFQRSWSEYEFGFGSPSSGDFWVGLSKMKTYTDAGYRILRVVMQGWNNKIMTIQYKYFMLGSAVDRYRLHIGGYESSHILPDDFSYNDNMPFATIDRPDVHGCAIHQHTGWWFNYCTYVLPTGNYYRSNPYKPVGKFYDGIYYKDWLGYAYSLKYIKMELMRF